MRARPLWGALASCALLCGVARAEVWTDPDLAEALAACELVVRARAPAEGASGRPTVTFTVQGRLKGRTPSSTLEVGGLHDPTEVPGPVFQSNEEVYLILVRRDGRLEVPTPTFGRFPVRDGVVRHVALRDTYLRLDFDPIDFEAFVTLHLGREDALPTRWLERLRRHLKEGGPLDEGEARARHYLALEALALAGKPDDGAAIVKYLDPEGPFQLRISACRALAGAAGARGAGALFEAARSDPEPAVRTAAIRAMARLAPPPPELVERLATLLPEAPTGPVRFSGPNDPRLNQWPAPKVALLQAIARHGPAPVRAAILAVLDEEAPPIDVFSAALRALLPLDDDAALPRELVDRFRGPEWIGATLYNRELAAALTLLTGERLGEDPERWRRWARGR